MEVCGEDVTGLGPTTPVSYFPAFLDDELLYSTVARYHWAAGNADALRTKKRFFGSGSLPAVLPGSLDHFAARFPVGAVSAERLIERHTIFPYFAPFLSTQCAARTLSRMRGPNGCTVKASLGVVGSRVKDAYYLRLCIDCVAEQRSSGLQPYWRRVHQLPGVWHCPIHGAPLIDRCARCGPFNHRNSALLLPNTTCSQCGNHYASATPPIAGSDLGVSVARFAGLSADLLGANLPVLSPRLRVCVYTEALGALGIDARKPMLTRVIAARLRAYWGDEFLQKLGVGAHPRLAMPARMLRDSEVTTHPALHLLLIGFLFGSVEAFAARLRPQTESLEQAALGHLGGEAPDLLRLLKANGYDVAAIADASGVSVWTLAKDASKQGLTIGRFFRQGDTRRELLIVSGLKEGATIPDIAAAAAVGVGTVNRRLRASSEVREARSQALKRMGLRTPSS